MLTVREQMILDFEYRLYKYIGAKEQDIRELFGVTATRYYQELNQLIDREDAYASQPLLVQRVRGGAATGVFALRTL